MSLPDLLKDVSSATEFQQHSLPFEACKPKRVGLHRRSSSQSDSPDFEFESVTATSLDEGEAIWDALGRMNSIRRSNRFDRPQLTTTTLVRGPDGFGLELEGTAPPIVQAIFSTADDKGIKPGDRLLEVNGESVRGSSHQEARQMMEECAESVVLLIHTVKPPPIPSGKVVYSGWLNKRGGTGMTPRNWRRRWFVIRDDCVAYYYSSPDDTSSPLGAIVLHNYTISKATSELKRLYAFKAVKGGARTYCFAADSATEMNKWAQVFTEAANLENRETLHIHGSAQNVSVSALSIKDPECCGFVFRQGRGFLTWKRTYCILKNCQLFFYANMSNTTADGVLNLLNYYEICRGKSKEKKFYFQVVPTSKDLKIVNFYVEFSAERERWIEALTKATRTTTSNGGTLSISSSLAESSSS